MDHVNQQAEESITMDAEELKEGNLVGEDDEGELKAGEIIDSDSDLGGERIKEGDEDADLE